MKFLLNEESGQGMVEYGLVLVLVSIVAITALKSVGTELNTIFGKIKNGLSGGGTGA